jgi:hypothetical protein
MNVEIISDECPGGGWFPSRGDFFIYDGFVFQCVSDASQYSDNEDYLLTAAELATGRLGWFEKDTVFTPWTGTIKVTA